MERYNVFRVLHYLTSITGISGKPLKKVGKLQKRALTFTQSDWGSPYDELLNLPGSCVLDLREIFANPSIDSWIQSWVSWFQPGLPRRPSS